MALKMPNVGVQRNQGASVNKYTSCQPGKMDVMRTKENLWTFLGSFNVMNDHMSFSKRILLSRKISTIDNRKTLLLMAYSRKK